MAVMPSGLRRCAAATTCLVSLICQSLWGVAGAQAPKLTTNQHYVETVNQDTELNIDDLMSVFAFVLNSLPDEVTVYPSENYYYFSFVHDGLTYVGNLRLDVSDRDKGVVHFAHFRQYTMWQRGDEPTYKLLGKADGVSVEKNGPLAYTISYKGKTVLFNLFDLSDVKPDPAILAPNERYIGPVFDESGVQFYLLFNRDLKLFHYVLNEDVPVQEKTFTSIVSPDITIGLRTGFAYYQDKYYKRKILVGVHQLNSNVNNYFDGPFDQLPDNFIKGNILHDAIIAVDPDLEGRIDYLGNSPGGAERFYIGPYLYYSDETELAVFEECAKDEEITRATYHACFAVEQTEEEPEDLREEKVWTSEPEKE
jgi:hypothetical protein